MYIYYNKNGEISMISKGKIKAPNFRFINKNLTKKEKEDLENNNYLRKIINKKIVITERINKLVK